MMLGFDDLIDGRTRAIDPNGPRMFHMENIEGLEESPIIYTERVLSNTVVSRDDWKFEIMDCDTPGSFKLFIQDSEGLNVDDEGCLYGDPMALIKELHEMILRIVFGSVEKQAPSALTVNGRYIMLLAGGIRRCTPDHMEYSITDGKLYVKTLELKTSVKYDMENLAAVARSQYQDLYKGMSEGCVHENGVLCVTPSSVFISSSCQIDLEVLTLACAKFGYLRNQLAYIIRGLGHLESEKIMSNLDAPINWGNCPECLRKIEIPERIDISLLVDHYSRSATQTTMKICNEPLKDLTESGKSISTIDHDWTELPVCVPRTHHGLSNPFFSKLKTIGHIADPVLEMINRLETFEVKSDEKVKHASTKRHRVKIGNTLGYEAREDLIRGLFNAHTDKNNCGVTPEDKMEYRVKKQTRVYRPSDEGFNTIVNLLSEKLDDDLCQKDFWCPLLTDEDEYLEDYQKLWYQLMRFMTRLGEELNIGKKRHSVGNDFVVSKVAGYECLVLAHNTGPQNHLFFHILFRGKRIESIFSKWKNVTDDIYITSVIRSVMPSRIEQMLNMFPKLYASHEYFMNRFKSSYSGMIAAAVMISLDGKQATIDYASALRFVYMNMNSYRPWLNHIVNDRIGPIRTRMQSLIVFRMVVVINRFYTKIRSSGMRSILNWTTLLPARSLDEILTLSYLHYSVKAKKEITLHSESNVIKKVTQEELKLNEARPEKMGTLSDMGDKRSHEFNASLVYSMGNFLAEYLSREDKLSTILQDFKRTATTELTWSKFATMKKSTYREGNEVMRRECMVSVDKMFDEFGISPDVTPLSQWSTILNQIHKLELYDVTVFPKDQQTGMREIFVMNMHQRISVSLSEWFWRCVGSRLPNENLSRPILKDLTDPYHEAMFRERLSRSSIGRRRTLKYTLSSSSDAKTWCQRWVMPCFKLFVEGFLGSDLWPEDQKEEIRNLKELIFSTLDSVTLKRLHLSRSLREKMSRVSLDDMHDELIREIHQICAGTSELNYDSKPGVMVNYSNMMQGVLHVLSSMLHATYLLWLSEYLERYIHGAFLRKGIRSVVVVSTQATSDDSAVLLSCAVDSDEFFELQNNEFIKRYEQNKHRMNMSFEDYMMYMKQYDEIKYEGKDKELIMEGRHTLIDRAVMETLHDVLSTIEYGKVEFGACLSTSKSTICSTTKTKELNSIWLSGHNCFPVSYKFMMSAFSISYHPTFLDRIQESMSLLTQMYKEGVNSVEIYGLQKLLQITHMRTMVPYDNQGLVMDHLRSRNPFVGHFPVLPVQVCGMFSITTIMKMYRERFDALNVDLEIYNSLTPSMTFGTSTRYRKILEKLNVDRKSLESIVTQSKTTTLNYLASGFLDPRLIIKEKALSKGIKLSSSSVPLSTIYSSSCYMFSKEVVLVKNNLDIATPSDDNKLITLESLLRDGHPNIVRREIRRRKKDDPMSDLWSDLFKSEFILVPRDRPTKRRKIVMKEVTKEKVFSLDRMAFVLKWFDDTFEPDYYQNRCIEIAMGLEPRLDLDLQKTIDNFNGSVLSLKACLDSLSESVRTITMILSKKPNDIVSMQMLNLRENYSKDNSLVKLIQRNVIDGTEVVSDEVRQTVCEIINTPLYSSRMCLLSKPCKYDMYLTPSQDRNNVTKWYSNITNNKTVQEKFVCSLVLSSQEVPISTGRSLGVHYINLLKCPVGNYWFNGIKVTTSTPDISRIQDIESRPILSSIFSEFPSSTNIVGRSLSNERSMVMTVIEKYNTMRIDYPKCPPALLAEFLRRSYRITISDGPDTIDDIDSEERVYCVDGAEDDLKWGDADALIDHRRMERRSAKKEAMGKYRSPRWTNIDFKKDKVFGSLDFDPSRTSLNRFFPENPELRKTVSYDLANPESMPSRVTSAGFMELIKSRSRRIGSELPFYRVESSTMGIRVFELVSGMSWDSNSPKPLYGDNICLVSSSYFNHTISKSGTVRVFDCVGTTILSVNFECPRTFHTSELSKEYYYSRLELVNSLPDKTRWKQPWLSQFKYITEDTRLLDKIFKTADEIGKEKFFIHLSGLIKLLNAEEKDIFLWPISELRNDVRMIFESCPGDELLEDADVEDEDIHKGIENMSEGQIQEITDVVDKTLCPDEAEYDFTDEVLESILRMGEAVEGYDDGCDALDEMKEFLNDDMFSLGDYDAKSHVTANTSVVERIMPSGYASLYHRLSFLYTFPSVAYTSGMMLLNMCNKTQYMLDILAKNIIVRRSKVSSVESYLGYRLPDKIMYDYPLSTSDDPGVHHSDYVITKHIDPSGKAVQRVKEKSNLYRYLTRKDGLRSNDCVFVTETLIK